MGNSRSISRRRGTAEQHEGFTGANAEITVDTTNNRAVVHDGETPGGHPQATEKYVDDKASLLHEEIDVLTKVPNPLTNSIIQPEGSNPRPVDYFNGVLYGAVGDELFKSTDDGGSWESVSVVGTGSGRIVRILPTSDGEVLVARTKAIWKSQGWPGNPTWTQKLSVSDPGNSFLEWGFDGDGEKFIATDYVTPHENQKFVWASVNSGESWEVIMDEDEDFPGDPEGTHTHGVAYDQWADWWWLAMGDTIHDGIYYKPVGAAEWTEVEASFTGSPQATAILAMESGLIVGSDSGRNNGMYRILHRENPDDMRVEFIWRWPSPNISLNGFADRIVLSKDKKRAYVSWRSERDEIPPIITATDGYVGGLVYEYDGEWEANDRIRNITITDSNRLIGWIQKADSVNEHLFADITRIGATPSHLFDSGGLRGGNSAIPGGVAVGALSKAPFFTTSVGVGARTESEGTVLIGAFAKCSSANDQVVVGRDAESEGENSVVVGAYAISEGNRQVIIGSHAKGGSSSVVVGYESEAQGSSVVIGQAAKSTVGNSSVVVGHGATSSAQNNTVIGWGAESTAGDSVVVGLGSKSESPFGVALGRSSLITAENSVAIGHDSSATADDSTCVGQESESSAIRGVAIGRRAKVTEAQGIAVGRSAESNHNNAIAFGFNTTTGRTNSAAFGDRDIELQGDGRGVITRSPDGTLYKITVDNAGEIQVGAV